jgi:hypothetical protein
MADELTTFNRDAASNLWRNTLSRIPSIFGRLVYLAGLRNPNTLRYEHHGLALVYDADASHRALKRSHAQAFSEWLNFDLEQQKEDLDLYLSSLLEDKGTVLRAWDKLDYYKNILPSSIRGPERRLYLADLAALVATLRNEYGAAGPDPDA